MSWIQTIRAEDLEKKGRVVVRSGPKQIAILKVNGHVFALDNRCPHEGYPLAEGSVNPSDCLLTCIWHNWKFDMKTGANVLGEDDVNVYPAKIESGSVWIQIPQLSRDVIAERILSQYHTAFRHQQYERIARELARLYFNKIDPLLALQKAIQWSYKKLEFGMDHSYAVTADWLALYTELPEIEERLICLTEGIDYISETSLRQPDFPYSERVLPFSHEDFISAVEREDEDTAVALVNGALADGMHFPDLERSLTEAALAHYNDFGHSLIYLTKVRIFVDLLGPDLERFLLPPLIRSICLATREDLLREFQSYQTNLQQWKPSWPETADAAGLNADELYGKGLEKSMRWVVEHAPFHSPEQLYRALLQANAKSLLHYDMSYQFSYQNSVAKNIGWLDFTHGITFANSVREQCTRFPQYWRQGLLQMACFIGRNHHFLDSSVEEEKWMVPEKPAFFQETLEFLLDHGKRAAIFTAHYVKTFLAVRKEAALADERCANYLVASFHRFLKSPLKEKHVRRTIRQALELVGRDFVES